MSDIICTSQNLFLENTLIVFENEIFEDYHLFLMQL
jgi:hypothetical protein